MAHVAGYTLCNEGTIRDWVRHAKFNVTQGKNFDSTGSLGPWLVPYTDESQMGGQKIKSRVTLKELSPTAYTFKLEIQGPDGKWAPVMESKSTKQGT